MAKGDKLKLNKRDFLFFLVPFFVLSLIIGLIGHTNANRRIDDIKRVIEDSTMDIGDSYAQVITNTQEMNGVIEKLMEEKLLLVGQAISLLDQDKLDSNQLKDMAEKFQVWRINIFDDRGIIIHSNEEGNVGWVTYDGHPTQDFLLSGQESLIEKIRIGSINDIYFKFGYIRRDDKSFIQIGIEADDFHRFTKSYHAREIIDSIITREDILHVFLVDMDGRLIASSMDLTPGMPIDSKGIKGHINDINPGIERHHMGGKEVLHGYAPLTIDGKRAGLLSIVWDTSMIDTVVKETMYSTLGEFLITIFIIGSVLYYAFRKNKSNVKIAYYDRLTGLPNVEYMEEFIEKFVEDMDSIDKTNKAILFINLTNFKLINMTYGYNYGDKILVNLSREIKYLLDEGDMLSIDVLY